jgi:DNA-binding IclR family transcriptional regulator
VLEPLAGEVGETVSLLVPTASGLVPVAQWQAPQVASVNIVGVPLGLHATASGKLRLAFAEDRERAQIVGAGLQRFTAKTILDDEALDRELVRVRQLGYATERDEFELGVSGVSVPVIGREGKPLAFISIWGLTARLSGSRLKQLAGVLQRAAEEIASRLAPPPEE